MRPRTGAFFRRSSSIAETVAAINRTILTGLEGNFAGLSALSAHGVVHLAFATTAALAALAGHAAGFAALGLILKAALRVKLLLTGGENEFLSAILADQCLVLIHEIPLLKLVRLGDVSFTIRYSGPKVK